jgi:dienelactone hydrolase
MRYRDLLLAGGLLLGAAPAYGQSPVVPDTVPVRTGALDLRALVWRPPGAGPFPAVFFNHGSYSDPDTLSLRQTTLLGETFARHGYLFLVLFRRGVGLSRDQGIPEGTLLSQAFAAGGQTRRNTVQLQLLHDDGLSQALAGLAALRAQPAVALDRVAVVGHSFGGGLTVPGTAGGHQAGGLPRPVPPRGQRLFHRAR